MIETINETNVGDGYVNVFSVSAGICRASDSLKRQFRIERAVDENLKPKRNQWHLYQVVDGVQEYWNTFATRGDCIQAIANNAIETIAAQQAKEPAKKVIMATCKHCGVTYEAQRTSSQFCKPAHRVAYNRAQKKAAKLAENDVFAQVRKIGSKLYERELGYQSMVTLVELSKVIRLYIGELTRYWICDDCDTKVMNFLPEIGSCKCKSGSNWRLVDTRKRDD